MDTSGLDINAFLLKALLNNGNTPRAPGILGELEQQVVTSLRKLMNIEDTQTTDLTTQVATLRNDIAQKNSIIADFSKQIMDFKTEISQKNEMVSSNTRQLSETRTSISQKETSIADMSKQIIDLNLTKSRNETALSELRIQISGLQSDSAQKDTLIGNLNGEITNEKNTNHRVQTENSILATEYANYKKQMDIDMKSLRNHNETLITVHNNDLETLRCEKTRLEEIISQRNCSENKELEKINNDNLVLRCEKTHLEEIVSRNKSETEQLINDNLVLRCEKMRLETEIAELGRVISDKTIQINDDKKLASINTSGKSMELQPDEKQGTVGLTTTSFAPA